MVEIERDKSIINTTYQLKDFTIVEEIGNGAYAKVYKADYGEDRKTFALKVIDKRLMIKENKLHHVYIEYEILQMLDFPLIGKAYGLFEENGKLILVLDYYENGDLFDFVKMNSKHIS
jgi:serine/threonine protein kinase